MFAQIRGFLMCVVWPVVFLGLGACGASVAASAMANRATPAAPIAAPVIDLWVDPLHGDNSWDGATRATALRTITAAWQRIPAGVPLQSAGYRIRLVAGDYADSSFPVYWEDRQGTANYPIRIEAADGARTARLSGYINMANVDYVELRGLAVTNQGDVFHCEQCRHIVIDDTAMDGVRQAHETIKINQSQYITIENSDIQGSYENAIDFVAVQYATIRHNRIHGADDWCAYVKGGSAYISVEANTIYDCGTGGFTAGQGTGFEYMTSPWLHYEAYAVRVVNNVIHDTEGAGLGVNGGYDILFAYNTLYRVGARSHVLEVVHGGRSCDEDSLRCQDRHAQGGWGPIQVGGDAAPIPNRNVFIYNNLIVNPAGYQSQWQHLTVHGPLDPPAGLQVPSPALTDDNLHIVGNVIWNGPANHALGLGDDSGCQPANPTCNEQQLRRDNAINTVEPHFVDVAALDFRLAHGADLPAPWPIPDFPTWVSLTPSVPAASDLRNSVTVDYTGNQRSGFDLLGAFADSAAPPATSPTATMTATMPATTPAAARLHLPAVQNEVVVASPTPSPADTPTPLTTPAVTPPPTGSVLLLALGDSLTEGERDDSGSGGGFPRRLETFLQAARPASTVHSLGRSGWTSAQVILGANGQSGQLPQALHQLNATGGAKIATLWIGSNDLWYLYDARPDPMADDQEQQNLAAYTANVRTIVAQLRGAGATVLLGLLDDQSLRPVVAAPPNPAEPAFPNISADDRTRMSQQVGRYNAALRALAAEIDNVIVVDFFGTDIFTNPATLADDGNHPNGAGYDAIAALWQAALAGWLAE